MIAQENEIETKTIRSEAQHISTYVCVNIFVYVVENHQTANQFDDKKKMLLFDRVTTST